MVDAVRIALDITSFNPHAQLLGGIAVLLTLTDTDGLSILKREFVGKHVEHVLRTSGANHLTGHLLMHLLTEEVHLAPHIVLHRPHGEVLNLLRPLALGDIEHHGTKPGADNSTIGQLLGKNLGILAAVHDINLAARYADRIILLPPKKSVLSGAPSDIMNTDNLKYTFGVDFECKEIKSFQSLQ